MIQELFGQTLRLALATFALKLDAFEARLKLRRGKRGLRPILRRMRQRLLMFLKPNPIAHVDTAAAERATCLNW